MNVSRSSILHTVTILLFFLIVGPVGAQNGFGVQVLQRAELRHGYGRLMENGDSMAAFIGQRTRLHGNFQKDKVRIYASVQDVRLFGSTPQIKFTDPFLSVHEAFTEFCPDTIWTLKIGRQELNYDNARFLGNLDWALQGRAHDFVLLKYHKGPLNVHAGGAYNQQTDRLSGRMYWLEGQYKTALMLWIQYVQKNHQASFLYWADGRQYSVSDSLLQIVDQGLRYRHTLGVPDLLLKLGDLSIKAFYYHQLGMDVKGNEMNAFDASLAVQQKYGKKQQGIATLGAEILSGNSASQLSGENRAFSPLYGTNHGHNGYMDYYYVGGRHENSRGLIDAFLRVHYPVNSSFFCSLNAHYFRSHRAAQDIHGNNYFYLGTELDLSAGYQAGPALSLQAGYSHMLAPGEALTILHRSGSIASAQHWGYLMLLYRPDMKQKFTGLQF